jgi:hypothetical protein
MRRPTVTAINVAALRLGHATAVALLFAGAGADAQELGSAWNGWQRAAPILVAGDGSGFVRVPLNESVDAGEAGNYATLRIVDESNEGVPYAIDPDRKTTSDERALPLSDSGYVFGQYTQVVVDFGPGGGAHDAIRIVAKEPTYFERVGVEASDDRKLWRTMRTDAIVYRVAGNPSDPQASDGNQQIAFDSTHARWLRLRVYDTHAAFDITGAFVSSTPDRDPLVPVRAAPVETSAGSNQTWTFRFGGVRVPITGVRVSGAPGAAFARDVSLRWSANGTDFESLGTTQMLGNRAVDVTATETFEEVPARAVQVTIDNGSDAPVPGLVPTVLRRPHALVFSAEPGHTYRLLADGPAAAVARYDLGSVLAARRWQADRVASVGPFALNPSYRDRRPLTDRIPWLTTAVFAVIALVLGAFAVVTIRKTSRAMADEGAP